MGSGTNSQRRDEPDVLEQVEAERLAAARERSAAARDRRQAAEDWARARQLLARTMQDDLTGAYTRGPGREQLTRAVERAHRTREPLVIVFLDADHLKLRNDEHGHAAGDELLREIGNALRASLRAYDIVVRYGGDEFVCALAGIGIIDARRRVRGVSHVLAQAVPGATISTGLVRLRPKESLEDVVARADAAMYSSRHQARSVETWRSSVSDSRRSTPPSVT